MQTDYLKFTHERWREVFLVEMYRAAFRKDDPWPPGWAYFLPHRVMGAARWYAFYSDKG